MNKILRIDPSDNVIVALKDLAAGEELQVEGGRLKVEELPPSTFQLKKDTAQVPGGKMN